MPVGTPLSRGSEMRGVSSADIVSASFTPAADAMLITAVNVQAAGATADAILGHDAGSAWAQMGSTVGLWAAANLSIWGCFTGSSPAAGTITVRRDTDTSRMIALWLEVPGVDVSGTVANALAQAQKSAGGYGSSRLLTFDSAPSDLTLFFCAVGYSQTQTLESSLTQLESEAASSIQVVASYDQDGGDTTPSSSWASAAPNGAHAIALKAAATGDVTVTPGAALLTLTSFAPTVTIDVTVAPPPANLTLTGLAPTVTVDATVAPPAASITMTGFAPTASTDVTVTPPTATLTITGFAPTVTVDATVAPPPALLTITGFPPTVTTGSSVTVTPPPATLTITGFAPAVTVDATVTPPPAALALTGFAPSLTVDVTVTPGPAVLTITGFPPTITTGVLTVDPDHVVTFAASRRTVVFGAPASTVVTFPASRRVVVFEV